MVTTEDFAAAAALLDDFTAGKAMAAELVARVDRAIALAEACADHAPENNAIIGAGRDALHSIADFFGVDVPGMVSQGEGRRPADTAPGQDGEL